jgi:hypothetical protein
MPTTTYSEDDDIIAADPRAYDLLPAADQAEAEDERFDRLRILAKAEINRRLLRREPAISEGMLGDTSELTEAEVRFVLHYIYRDASVRAGDDLLWVKAEHWKKEAEAEIMSVPLTISCEDVPSTQGGSVPIWRS